MILAALTHHDVIVWLLTMGCICGLGGLVIACIANARLDTLAKMLPPAGVAEQQQQRYTPSTMNEDGIREALADEDILVQVTLTHLPTGQTGSFSVHCPADEKPDTHEALQLASTQAADDLLSKLEQVGGG